MTYEVGRQRGRRKSKAHRDKANVNSFGVEVVDHITGRKVVDLTRPKRQQSFAEWKKEYDKENIQNRQATRGRAIIVGVGYYEYKDKVRGSANDARRMKDALVASGVFNHENTTLIVDSVGMRTRGKRFRRENVTARRITEAIRKMIKTAKPGDKLVVFMAGHGGIGTPILRGKENEDGAIGKKSYEGYFLAGDSIPITDEFFRNELEFLPNGCDFVLILDCCCAGSFKIGPRGIVLAGCKWFQLSEEYLMIRSNLYGGLFTNCLVKVMKKNRNKNLSYFELFAKVRDMVFNYYRGEGLVVVWEKNGSMKEVLPENVGDDQIILGSAHQIPVIHQAGGRGNRVFLGDAS